MENLYNSHDACIYVEEIKILYGEYTKPADAKRYVNTNSFLPGAVFDSVPSSQMLRTISNYSKETIQMDKLNKNIIYFANGYYPDKLSGLKAKASEAFQRFEI